MSVIHQVVLYASLGLLGFSLVVPGSLATLVSIARALSTTPNHLLGVETAEALRSERDRSRARLVGALDRLSAEDVERVMVQVEALGRHRGKVSRS